MTDQERTELDALNATWRPSTDPMPEHVYRRWCDLQIMARDDGWHDQQLRRLHLCMERRRAEWPNECGDGSGYLTRAMRMLEQADEYLEQYERDRA